MRLFKQKELSPEAKKQIENKIRVEYQTWYNKGLAVGCKSISKVIYDIATEPKTGASKKLKKIIKFCETGLRIKEGDDKNET